IGGASRIMDYVEKSRLEPGLELENAQINMSAVESYRYHITAEFEYEGRKEVISELAGEKEMGKTHIKGEMVNSAVDIYFIDGMIYNYDSYTKKWMLIDSGRSNSEELLIAELNPLSNLRFITVGNPEKLGFEEADGVECLVVKCHPEVDSQALANLWKDFEYVLWIDYKTDTIRKFTLTATSKANAGTTLHIKVDLTDLDEEIGIKAPQ
ncbi:MAG: hypothetical protein Q4B48_06295, partial [Syntrophomonadaceae bacterium]|nr:hypothetical protein [Syntrophomonadaceae bacterium]